MPLSSPKSDARNQRLQGELQKKLQEEKNIQQIAGEDARRQKRMNELLDQIRPLDAQLKAIDAQLKNSPKPLLLKKLTNDRAAVVGKLGPLQAEYNKLAKQQSQIPAAHRQAMARYDQLVDEIQLLKQQLGLK
jgi:chromosome segregation ATPase